MSFNNPAPSSPMGPVLLLLLHLLLCFRQCISQHLSPDETDRRMKYPANVAGDFLDNPFVPDEFSRPIVDFTNDTLEVSSLSVKVLAILNNEVENQTNAFSRLTFDYAGKKLHKGHTVYYLKISTQACFAHDDFCQTLNCRLELETSDAAPAAPTATAATSSTSAAAAAAPASTTLPPPAAAAAAATPSLAITHRICERGTFCYFCDEERGVSCPRVDEYRPSNGNENMNELLHTIDCDHSSNLTKSSNQTWTCTTEFYEVAGIRTYTKLGCLGQEVHDLERACRSDQNNYKQSCTCTEPLCNNPYRVNIHPRYQFYLENREIFVAMRQLKAHIDKNMGRCGEKKDSMSTKLQEN